MNKTYLNWQWIDDHVENLAQAIEEGESTFDFITGIPRGGLTPSVYLSHRLEIEYIPFHKAIELSIEERQRVLVVDDICDSGQTVFDAQTLGFPVAVLALRHDSPHSPEYFSTKIIDDQWLVFPWESLDSNPIQDYLVDPE